MWLLAGLMEQSTGKQSETGQNQMPKSRMKDPSEYVEMMDDEKLSNEMKSMALVDLAKTCSAVTMSITMDLERQGVKETDDPKFKNYTPQLILPSRSIVILVSRKLWPKPVHLKKWR